MGQAGWTKDLSKFTEGKILAVLSPILFISFSIAFCVLFMTLIEPLSGVFWVLAQVTTWVLICIFGLYLIYKRRIFNILIHLGLGIITFMIAVIGDGALITGIWGLGILFWQIPGDSVGEYFRNILTTIFVDGSTSLTSLIDVGGHIYFTLLNAFAISFCECLVKFLLIVIVRQFLHHKNIGFSFVALTSVGFSWFLGTVWLLLYEMMFDSYVAAADDLKWHINGGVLINRTVMLPLVQLANHITCYYLYELFRRDKRWYDIIMCILVPMFIQFVYESLSFGLGMYFIYDITIAPTGLLVMTLVSVIVFVAALVVGLLCCWRWNRGTSVVI